MGISVTGGGLGPWLSPTRHPAIRRPGNVSSSGHLRIRYFLVAFAHVPLKMISHICWLCPHCREDSSPAMVSRSFSPVAVRGLLIAEASLVVQHHLQAHRLQQLWLMDSVALQHVGCFQTRG